MKSEKPTSQCEFLISVTEYNSMINFNESRAILPPEDNKSWKMWDKVSRYQVKKFSLVMCKIKMQT